MAKLAQTRPAMRKELIAPSPMERAWSLTRPAAVPAAVLLLALLVRTYRLQLQAWMPDTYEQLSAARALVAGHFPLSHLYPPGVAITLAPAMLLLPQTLASMQVVILAAGLILIVVAYVCTARATGDRGAAALLALALAVAPPFVYFSRDGLFDIIGTAWIVSAILIVPSLRGRGSLAFVAYGVMLSIAINVRATNAAFLPALLIYWTDAGRAPIRPKLMLSAAARREVLLAGAVMLALSALYAYIGGWTGHAASHTPISFALVASNVPFYVVSELGGVAAAPLVLPLMIAGAAELWRRNRTLLIVCLYMMTIWPLVHAPLPFANGRYMLPALAFTLLVAAHGPAATVPMYAAGADRLRRLGRPLAVGLVVLVGIIFGVGDGIMLYGWPHTAGKSDEAAFKQLRPIVAQLPEGSLVVSPVIRGVRESNARVEYLDLIDYSLPRGNGPDSVDAVVRRIAEARSSGRNVYYIYSRFEARRDDLGNGGPGFDRYFAAVEQRFRVTEAFATSLPEFKLYSLD